MKSRIYIRHIILPVLLIICSPYDIFSQGTDITSERHLGMFIGISSGPSQSKIINEGTSSIANLMSVKKYSFFGSMEIGYFFSRYLGLTSGIGFNPYKGQLSLSSYQSNYDAIDSDNESYEQRVSANSIQELQNISFLSIPLCINFRIPFGEAAGMFFQAGTDMTVPLSKDYHSSGIFTYKGFYPAYNVLFENLPQHRFPSNYDSNADGELELKPFGFNIIGSAGFDFSVSQKIQIAIAGVYDKSLSNISEYTSPDDFQLSSDVDQISSMMEGSTKATTQLICLKIILRYYFR